MKKAAPGCKHLAHPKSYVRGHNDAGGVTSCLGHVPIGLRAHGPEWSICGAADCLETVHPQGTLMAYETALDDWQKPERVDEGYGWPDHSVQPNRRVGPEFLDKNHEGTNGVARNCFISALTTRRLYDDFRGRPLAFDAKVPNAVTARALRKAGRGEDFVRSKNAADLFGKLGI